MNDFKRIMLIIRYNIEWPGLFGVRKLYYEGNNPPLPSVDIILLDKWIQRVTGGRLHMGQTRMYIHHCPICNKTFWSEKKVDNKPCRPYGGARWHWMPHECYLKYYGGANGQSQESQQEVVTPPN